MLDGWWAEAYDGTNGWAMLAGDGSDGGDGDAQDQRDADALFDLLEREVVPLFYQRSADGLPQAWLAKVRASLRTNGPHYSATRMVEEYISRIYAPA